MSQMTASHKRSVRRGFIYFSGVLCMSIIIFNLRTILKTIDYSFLDEANSETPTIIQNYTNITQSVSQQSDTTIIVSSNLIPSHPSIRMITETIQSIFQHALGLHKNTHVIITVDLLPLDHSQNDTQRFNQYIANLHQYFPNSSSVTILPLKQPTNLTRRQKKRYRGLSWNIFTALQLVHTPFVYIIQHDMPFLKDFWHTNITVTMMEYPNDLRIVRFSRLLNKYTRSNKLGTCWNATTPVDHVNGLHFVKTPGWSDNNQIGQKTYYDEIFERFIIPERRFMPMEHVMRATGVIENCTYWAPHLYGRINVDGEYIGHLDGRLTLSY